MKWSQGNLACCLAAGIGTMVLVAASVRADHSKAPPLAAVSPHAQEAIESANSLSSAFRAVANQLLPSVVAIENRPAVAWNSNRHVRPSRDAYRGENPFRGTPLEKMFPDFDIPAPPMNQPGGGIQPRHGGIGSGVIIDDSGIVLTNNHVVAGEGEITVRTHDGRKFVATEVWTDPQSDLAVVKIENASDLVAATLGNSDHVEIGDWVLALGQPFGLESTVTAGIISAKHRGIGIAARENFLQTDAAINPGNSGGPLVNLRGEVVGINTAIHSRSGGNNGIGFAIPSNLARWVSDQLVNHGSVKRAYLGVGIQPVNQELAKRLSVKVNGGVVVTEVYPDTPAEKAGLKSGDVIVKLGDAAITTPQALQLAVEKSPLGTEVPLEIVRHGKTIQLTFQVTQQPSDFAAMIDGPKTEQHGKRSETLGIEIAAMDSDVAKRPGLEGTTGVVITSVRSDGAGAAAGLTPGMVIIEVEHQQVNSVAEFEAAIKNRAEDSDGTLLLVRTAKGSRYIVVKS